MDKKLQINDLWLFLLVCSAENKLSPEFLLRRERFIKLIENKNKTLNGECLAE